MLQISYFGFGSGARTAWIHHVDIGRLTQTLRSFNHRRARNKCIASQSTTCGKTFQAQTQEKHCYKELGSEHRAAQAAPALCTQPACFWSSFPEYLLSWALWSNSFVPETQVAFSRNFREAWGSSMYKCQHKILLSLPPSFRNCNLLFVLLWRCGHPSRSCFHKFSSI